MARSYILIQGCDVKTALWGEATKRCGVDIIPTPGTPILWPIRFIRSALTRGLPRAVVFRYLNDYPQLWKTALRLVSEAVCVLICWLLRVPIIWICHNVDQESASYYPAITWMRRTMMQRFARRIFVTDQLLVEKATEVLSSRRSEIDVITFGQYIRDSLNADSHLFTRAVQERTIEWRTNSGANGDVVMVGLCAGSPSKKMVHYGKIPELIENAGKCGFDVRLVIAGPIGDFLKAHHPDAYDFIINSDRVFFWDGFVPIAEHDIAPYIDFYWRAYADYSVPFSVYSAASVGKPILALDVGFLPIMVRNYRLGAVVARDMSNVGEALDYIRSWSPDHAREFLSQHTWHGGAMSLMCAAGIEVVPEARKAAAGVTSNSALGENELQ